MPMERWPKWFWDAITADIVSIHEDNGVYVETLEGRMKVDFGDYIIRGVNGELYPCKPDIFAKTYEKV